MQTGLMCLISLGLTAAVLGNAWNQRQQFYPSVVYITKSNPSMAVIYLQSMVVVALLGKLMRKIFFGQLRAAEFEHLIERSWYAVTETCLAFTVFKDDFSAKFVALFVLLLFLKSFHWLAEDRVDFMERSPVITILFHIRVLSLAVFLAALDVLFIQYAYNSTLTKGASVQLVFGFEYAILLTIILNTLVKYVLHSIDLNSETPWENKAVFMLYTELFIGFIKVLLYVLFFFIMVRIFTLPLFAVRPMYLTIRAFKKAFNDVVLSRRAIHNMNTLYPDATAEELESSDNVCIICREEMVAPSAKKLPCGHIFHRSCLRSWFQRQQTCPTCRLDVLRAPAAATPPPPAAANFQQQVAALRQQLEALQQQRNQQQQQNLPNLLNLMGVQPQPQQQQAGVAAAQAGVTPPAAAAANTGAAAAATATQPSATPAAAPAGPPPTLFAAGRPPLMMPPFPPFMAFNVPPPMPPPNFQGMSEAELHQMEGQERQNVEARIRCLRNVQVLLDAAVLEMQQYSSVVARCSAQQTFARTASETAAEATTTAGSTATTTAGSTTVTTAGSTTAATNVTTTASVSTAATTSSPDVDGFANTGARPKASSASLTASSGGSRASASSLAASSPSQVLEKKAVSASLEKDDTNDTKSFEEKKAAEDSVAKTTADDSSSSPKEENKKENPFEVLANNSEQDEIRRRRLAVFEEQKKRLMKK